MSISTSEKFRKDWTHWDLDTYSFAGDMWSALFRDGVDLNDDTEDSREFKRISENCDKYLVWWNQHDYPPPLSSMPKATKEATC